MAAKSRVGVSITLIWLVASSALGAGTGQGYTDPDVRGIGTLQSVPAGSGESSVPGTVIAWGSNDWGQATVPPEAQSGVTAIAAGLDHSLALKAGTVIAWGASTWGQTMVPVEALSGVSAIAAGDATSFAVRGGEVLAWGAGSEGALKVPNEARSGVTAIAAGSSHALALKDGAVIAWGSNSHGQTDVPVEAQSDVVQIAAGWRHSIALTRFGKVIAWGASTYGWGPITVPSETQSGVSSIAAGGALSLALKNGKVIAWGGNWPGQDRVPAEAQSGVDGIAAGSGYSLALKDGKVIYFGTEEPSTVPDAAQSRVSAIAAGYRFALAIRSVRDAPLPPIRVSGIAGDGQVDVSWGLPTGSEPATSFRVTASPAGRSCTSVSPVQTCTVTGLTNGAWYTFTVTATNSVGSSAPSRASEPVRPRTVPGAPVNVQGIPGHGAALVTWQPPPSDGGSEVTEYTVSSWPGGRLCVSAGTTSCVVDGLTNGTTYTFAVIATNEAGDSQVSPDSAPVTPTSALPTAPFLVKATPGNARVIVNWQAPASDGGSAITGYTAAASPGGRTCSTTGALTCTITGLSNGTPYTFTVTATNAAGTSVPSDPSVPVTPTASITKPGAVSNLKAASARGSLRITWSPPANMGGAPSVTYQYQVGKQAWRSTSSTFVVIKGKKGTRITAKVRALNSAGFGPSANVSGIPR